MSKLPQLLQILWHDGPQLPVSLSIYQAQLHRMVLQKCCPLSDGDQGDTQLGCMPAQLTQLNTLLASEIACSSSCCQHRTARCVNTQVCRAMAFIKMTGIITCTGAPQCLRSSHWCTRPTRQILDSERTAAPCPSVAARLQAIAIRFTSRPHLWPDQMHPPWYLAFA